MLSDNTNAAAEDSERKPLLNGPKPNTNNNNNNNNNNTINQNGGTSGSNKLKRNLDSTHLQMIAIGGTIGTGLFVGSGAVIATAGPLGSLVAFGIVSIMVFCIVTSLGEMATYLPISGSFVSYAARFVDPALSYTLGWNYWAQWALSLPSELSALGIIINYWTPTPSWIWSLSFLMLLFSINAYGVRSFADTEVWLSGIKIIAVLIFVVIGLLVDVGSFGEPAIGFSYYTIPDAPFKNGLLGIVNVFLLAFFSFGGTELVGITAGETKNPRKNVPKAIYGTFWRILLFYILSIFVMGLVIRHDDPKLLLNQRKDHALDPSVSPFTLVFDRIPIGGSKIMAHMMNGVILSAVLSAGNSAMYAGSRTLMAMAREGTAPRMFAKVNSRGVPMNSLILITAIGCLAFLGSFFGNAVVFETLLSMTGISGILTWMSISVIHLRFRSAFKEQNRDIDVELPYKSPFYPYGAWIGIITGLGIVCLQGFAAIQVSPFKWQNLLTTYIGIPIFVGLYIYYKLSSDTKLVKPALADLDSGCIWARTDDCETLIISSEPS